MLWFQVKWRFKFTSVNSKQEVLCCHGYRAMQSALKDNVKSGCSERCPSPKPPHPTPQQQREPALPLSVSIHQHSHQDARNSHQDGVVVHTLQTCNTHTHTSCIKHTHKPQAVTTSKLCSVWLKPQPQSIYMYLYHSHSCMYRWLH